MDRIGPIARSATDAATLVNTITGYDPRDWTSAFPDEAVVAPRLQRRRPADRNPRWHGEVVGPSVATAAAEVAQVLAHDGAEIVNRAPDVMQSVMDWAMICAVEAAVAHIATFPSRRSDYGTLLASVLDHGRVVSAADCHGPQWGAVAELVEIESGVVSGVSNPNDSALARRWRPRHHGNP
jgi:amidase